MNTGRDKEVIADLEPELVELDQDLEILTGLTTAGTPVLSREFHLALEEKLDQADARTSRESAPVIPIVRLLTYTGLAAAACFAVFLGIKSFNQVPAGELLYSQGSTSAGLASSGASIKSGDELVTGEGRLIASLESRITMILNDESTVKLVDSDHISLERGEVWVHVKPGSGHFRIDLPGGEGVDVIGTSFTVAVESDGSSVETYSGTVRYGIDSAQVKVVKGQKSHWIDSESRPTPPASSSTTAPEWTTSLIEEYHAASMKTFFPSVAPAGKE